MRRVDRRFLGLLLLLPVLSCQSMYYGTMEKLGVHKREILVNRVQEARDDQSEAREQFRTALEHFSAITGFEGGDLEAVYDDLNEQLRRSESKADDVRDRIDSIESVAQALFDEWEMELDAYSDEELRRASEESLKETRGRYDEFIRAMRRAEAKMDPVLDALGDQVLFLKHNLNARAIASLEENVITLEHQVAELIEEMERSIEEANSFIESMGGA